MADTKKGRKKKAHEAENRQRQRELEQERDRADEAEPLQNEQNEPSESHREENSSEDSSQECRRRGCNKLVAFLVLERYQEDTGHGAVEAEAALCGEHTAEESPTNLDGVYANYVFQVTSIPETSTTDTA